MTFFLSAFVFPVLAVAVLFGLGALVAAFSDRRVAPELAAPIGLGVLIVLGMFVSWLGLGAVIGPLLMLLLAASGLLLWRRRGAELWLADADLGAWRFWLPAAVIAGGTVLATVIFTGHETMAGFMLDTTSSVQMAGGEMALHGSDQYASLVHTSSERVFQGYFGANSYPDGSQTALALLSATIGVNLLWVYTPFMAVMIALTAMGLARTARLLEMPTRWAAFSGCVASIGALVYAFALQGSIKEIAFLPLLVILGNLILDRDLRSSTRALALVGGFAAAGSIGSIGLPALGWILPLGGVALLANWKRFGGERGLKQLAVMAGVVAVALVLMTLPRAEGAINQLNLARDLSQTNTALANDPGNLRRPIGKEQSLGAWFGSSHLVAPQQREGTIVALGIIFVLFLLGGLSFLLRRRWLWIAWAGTLFGIWYVLTWRGTMWIDAKLVMLASNAVLMVALYGAWQLRDQLRPKLGRALAYGGAGVIALSVFASAGAQYLATTILPTDRYNELSVINERFAGQGPAFTPDFDENGLFVLRDIGVTGPGYAYTDPGYTIRRDGTSVGYGGSADIDNIIDRRYADYPLVIQRRGPARSRPGSDYDLVLRGEFYESYKRNETQVVEHLQVGDPAVAVSVPYCKDILAIARRGDADDLTLLAAVPRAPVKFLAPTDVKITGDLAEPHPFGEIKGTGTIEFSADVKPGQKLWWNGAITRPIDVLVDGQRVGSFKYNVSGQGAIAGPLALPEGKHEITLKRGNGSLAPGGLGGGSFFGVTLAPADESEVIEVDRKRAEAELCGRQIDWLELVRPTD